MPLLEGHLIYYVGETGRSFHERLSRHYLEHTAAKYAVYSAAEFARGEKVMLWSGHFGRNRKSDEECRANCERLSDRFGK